MISIFAKNEERRKNDEGMIMTVEEDELKGRKEEQKERKIKEKKSNRVGHI